jgi:hypothetical protein
VGNVVAGLATSLITAGAGAIGGAIISSNGLVEGSKLTVKVIA